jgi:uncharacterized protein YfaS (alpha-2-macroglobulin family)
VRRQPFLSLVAAGCLAAAMTGCGRSADGGRQEVGPQDPLWSSYISYHTTGEISRRGKFRVVFASDVVAEEHVGQTADAVISVEPAIDASVTFSGPHELVVVPSQDLQPDQTYKVTVRRGDLLDIPENLERYEFLVHVIKQEFEVWVTGLSPDPADESRMTLRGTLVTADIEDADRIEQVISASFLNRPLAVEWQHDPDGRHHEFVVVGIERQQESQSLRLAWDGSAIGVSTRDERAVEVPAANLFAVTRVRAVQDERQYVLVQFSERLAERQNIRGLVGLSEADFTTSIEGNALRIAPQQALTGRVTVTLEPGIRSARGQRLESRVEEVVTFASNKPQVRFVGKGVVLPENDVVSIPFEAVNVHSVQVTAFRIYEANIGQFLQTNRLDGARELDRVGRYLWRKTISLSSLEVNEWNRYSLDVNDLAREHAGGLLRLTLSINRGNSTYNCTEEEDAVPVVGELPLRSADDLSLREVSSWDYAEEYFGVSYDYSTWRDRGDPCKDAYYMYADEARDYRNLLASNIGIVVKRDERGDVLVATTNLRTAQPMPGVSVTFRNFQNQPIGELTTDGAGIGRASIEGIPYYAVAEKGEQVGYLKLSEGVALPTSHFDVGGAKVEGGLKGYIYGERGVWRPGDNIHLTFVLEDQGAMVPASHPVSMQLFNPNGQRIQRAVNATPTGGFYTFTMRTPEDAPTGNWMARADVGGSSFSKTLKIETVIPNRLKVELEFEGQDTLRSGAPLDATLFGQWLSGAVAGNLRADVQVAMTPVATRFGRFVDFSFDDPAREFESEPQVIFDGQLDARGHAAFQADITPAGDPPGMLAAHFTTRVFENSGAFSTSRRTVPYSPYPQYVGVKLPKGDEARGMLLTDTLHTVEIAALSQSGEPVSIDGIQVSLYKIQWKWWWDRSGESLAQYASSEHRSIVERGVVNAVDGSGTWQFEINYPSWGRYLLRACDPVGRHCAGKVLYIDWPGWAGRAQEESGAGAAALTFFSDKPAYTVGEIAEIQLPEATSGRALVSIENGSAILEHRWIEFGEGRTRIEVPISAAMSPNAYVSVMLIQPHAGRGNDRPMRLYGVIPLIVEDPQTRLTPVIGAADEWRPESTASIEVSEASGRRMTYTLAVVDEGLLGLTSFRTPDLHAHFYQKEALGVATWDLFDEVVGAYAGELQRLLALGGGAEEEEELVQEEKSRFPPVVRFLGPFTLRSNDTNTHEIELPEYIGAVRVMVVAGEAGAYGSASKSVFVREPLSLLATLPRVLGPEEELTVPVSVFAMDEAIRRATVRLEADELFEVEGPGSAAVDFEGPGEKLAFLGLRVGPRLGTGRLRFEAAGAGHSTESEVHIEVRSPNPVTARELRAEIGPDDSWRTRVNPHGIPGTNTVSLELTPLPPLNLERHLRYLIRYPHGCVEQVTSAVFPQLYLPSLVRLEPDARQAVERNVQRGIERLRGFQVPSGAFVFWPGGFVGGAFDARNSWVSNYVGHFLVEADMLGHYVPPDMLTDWINFQKLTAQSWSAGGERSAMDQAYRLYTLALAGRPEMSAMNRLRESGDLSGIACWQLAAAYGLAGLPDVARELVRDADYEVAAYERPGWSLGSQMRDEAIILSSLVTLDMRGAGQAAAQRVSDALFSDQWHSTHALAYALLAMAKYYGTGAIGETFTFDWRIGDGEAETVTTGSPIYTAELADFPDAGDFVEVSNTSGRPLYGSIVVRGAPRAGEEVAVASGLALRVSYSDVNGGPVDVVALPQGGDFVAHLTVTNREAVDLENVVLTQIVPSGWELHNPRLDRGPAGVQASIEYQDIRDDRVYTYFSLKAGESRSFATLFNAAYLGKYYLPSVSVEAMYDASRQARTTGRWVNVIRPSS